MIFKRLEFGIFIRLLLLFGMLYLTQHFLLHYTWLQVASAALIMLAQIWELARFVTRSNNELARFIQAVKYRDFTQQFTEKNIDPSLSQLHQAFNQINQTLRELHIEKETQFQYLQTILQLIDTGIISFDEQGEIIWVNEAFKQTMHIPYLSNIDGLEQRNELLFQAICKLKPSENQLVKLKVNQQPLQLLLSSAEFIMQDKHLTLVAFKNVSTTIDETETEAWQKLLRVMTHEIMNSVAPIASLADTLRKHLKSEREKIENTAKPEVDLELLADTEEGISIIQNRSEGLLRFAQFYRNLSKVNSLMLTTIYVEELFNSIYRLLNPKLEQQGITFIKQTEKEDLMLQGDPSLLEQVLINLLVNAERAVKNRPDATIILTGKQLDNGRIQIEVADNGTGIPEEIIDSIFIPFFTSHKDGSGIGLSLAKHIMHLHKGSIQVQSEEQKGTVFSLVF